MRHIVFAILLSLVLVSPARADDPEEAAEKAAAKEFVKTIQTMVAEGKSQDIGKLVQYPMSVDYKPKIKNAAAFVKAYDTIFTPKVKECVRTHDLSEEVNSIKGDYMVGWGCLWFGPNDDGTMTIFSVNTKNP